ncbi:MAG: hypothetical protein U0768_10460 [Anaerolineae bacterium]
MRIPSLPSRRFAFALATLALLAVLAALPVLAQSAGAANAAASSASSRPLSTEQLIEQAYSKDEITAEQRILYLAYAVYDISKLPAQYHGTAGWYGTAAVAEINTTLQNQGTSKATPLSPTAMLELTRLTRPQGTLCDKADEPNTTETANFVINYGTINILTIDQYKTGLEKAFEVEVTSFGWPKPPFTAANTYNKYPVQVTNASSADASLYGYVTTNGGPYTGFIGNNPNTPAAETDAYATCMVINNDMGQFAGNDPAKSLQALNATTAHEYVHSIQFGVGSPSPTVIGMWIESTAAYAEDEVYPDSHDNYGYLWPLFQQSLAAYPRNNNGWYSNWPMFRYASEQNGGLSTPGGGEVVYKNFLALAAAGQAAIPAYDNALKAKGSNLNDLFHNFAIAIRFTKKCPVANPYCYSDGDSIALKMQNSPIQNDGEVASVGASYTGSITDTYSINYVGLPASGAYSVEVANTAANGELRASVVADTGDGLTVVAVPGVAGPGQTATLASFTVPAGTQRVILVITNQGMSSNDTPATTPYKVTLGAAGEGGTPTPPAETATPTATPTPSKTPTPPAETATPTATPTPSDTPTPPPGGYTHFAYLPLVGREYRFEQVPPSLSR